MIKCICICIYNKVSLNLASLILIPPHMYFHRTNFAPFPYHNKQRARMHSYLHAIARVMVKVFHNFGFTPQDQNQKDSIIYLRTHVLCSFCLFIVSFETKDFTLSYSTFILLLVCLIIFFLFHLPNFSYFFPSPSFSSSKVNNIYLMQTLFEEKTGNYNNYFCQCPLKELVESRSSEDSVKLLSIQCLFGVGERELNPLSLLYASYFEKFLYEFRLLFLLFQLGFFVELVFVGLKLQFENGIIEVLLDVFICLSQFIEDELLFDCMYSIRRNDGTSTPINCNKSSGDPVCKNSICIFQQRIEKYYNKRHS